MLLPWSDCAEPSEEPRADQRRPLADQRRPLAGARGSSKEKAFWAVHPRSFEQGILAFSHQGASRS